VNPIHVHLGRTSWKGFSKELAKKNGLIVQLGEVEEFHALGKRGCA
jgi:hypothetical protein